MKLGIAIKEVNGVIWASQKGFSLRSIQDVPLTTRIILHKLMIYISYAINDIVMT